MEEEARKRKERLQAIRRSATKEPDTNQGDSDRGGKRGQQ